MVQFRHASSPSFLLSSPTRKFTVHRIRAVIKGCLHPDFTFYLLVGERPEWSWYWVSCPAHISCVLQPIRFEYTSNCLKMLMHVPDIHRIRIAYMSPSEIVGTNKKSLYPLSRPYTPHLPYLPLLISLSALFANCNTSPSRSFLLLPFHILPRTSALNKFAWKEGRACIQPRQECWQLRLGIWARRRESWDRAGRKGYASSTPH